MNSQESSIERQSRRSFLVSTLGLILTGSSLSTLTSASVHGNSASDAPDMADLEIAALGMWLLESAPDAAGPLENLARQTAGLTPDAVIDWQIAHRAQSLLTERTRVSAELTRGDIVFVDGWLLANSEAATALLFAQALAQSSTLSPQGLEE
jgi:hypothetical protein